LIRLISDALKSLRKGRPTILDKAYEPGDSRMANAKTFVFRYEGEPLGDEEETDFRGNARIPKVHELLYRQGRTWMVTRVTSTRGKTIPLYEIFLADNSCRVHAS
jgi:hypothetical protein